MATKKKTAEKKKKSAAAKRGWATRRKKSKLIATIKKTTKIIRVVKKGAKKKPKTRFPTKNKTIDELQDIIKRQQQTIELLKESKGWVHAMPTEFLHKDGTIALEPSRLRHLGKHTTAIRQFLTKEDKRGNLASAVNTVAGAYHVPIREVYTLWYSP